MDLKHLPTDISLILAVLLGMYQEFVESFSATQLEWVPVPG